MYEIDKMKKKTHLDVGGAPNKISTPRDNVVLANTWIVSLCSGLVEPIRDADKVALIDVRTIFTLYHLPSMYVFLLGDIWIITEHG